MSQLDNRLKSLPLVTKTAVNGSTWLAASDIKAIKQAFTDAGYIQIPDVLVSGSKDITVNNERVMTGADWLARFKAELYKPKPQVLPVNGVLGNNDNDENRDRFYRAGGANFMYNKALQAARKSSGVASNE